MSRPTEACIEILVGAQGLAPDAASKHPLTLHVRELETRSQVARLGYPLLYLAIGLAFGAALLHFDAARPDDWNKVFGATLGVFSALLAFWKPAVELTQADCIRRLGGERLAGSDLQELNRMLALPTAAFERGVKLISALASFLAMYLLLRS